MKKILIPFAFLLCACSGQNTPQATVAAAEPADTVVAATAATTAEPAPEVDAASGATSVPNQTSFNGTLVIPPQSHATVTLTMDGTIRSTSLLPGAYVKRGALLATLENPAFIALQQTYLDSHAQCEFLRLNFCASRFCRAKRLPRRSVSSRARLTYFRCAAAGCRGSPALAAGNRHRQPVVERDWSPVLKSKLRSAVMRPTCG